MVVGKSKRGRKNLRRAEVCLCTVAIVAAGVYLAMKTLGVDLKLPTPPPPPVSIAR